MTSKILFDPSTQEENHLERHLKDYLGSKFNVYSVDEEDVQAVLEDLKYFDLFDQRQEAHISDVVGVRFDFIKFHLLFYSPKKLNGEQKLKKAKILGFCNLHDDFGQVIIRPERFMDKINEFFAPMEVDFAYHKQFSDKYYVLSGHEFQLRKKIQRKYLDVFARYENLHLEIMADQLLVRMSKTKSQQPIQELTDFLIQLLEVDQEVKASGK